MDLDRLRQHLQAFVAEREWEKFHTPKNLVMALTGEVGELNELFQWLTPEESARIVDDPTRREQVADEIADVLVYCFRLADVLGIDPEAAIWHKQSKNAAKYPVELAKGSALKYTELKKR